MFHENNSYSQNLNYQEINQSKELRNNKALVEKN